jgi:hypothetical protein
MRWGEILHPFRKRRDDALDDDSYALGLSEFFKVPAEGFLSDRRMTGAADPVEFDLPPHLYRELSSAIGDDGFVTIRGLTTPFHDKLNSTGRQ